MSEYHHIMVAVDFSKDAKLLIEKAVELALTRKAKLSAVHIDHTASQPQQRVFDISPVPLSEDTQISSLSLLQDLIKNTEYPIESHVFFANDFSTMITSLVETHEVSLLIMGHHRYNWLGEVIFSASEPVIRKMPCDILLVGV